MYSETYELNCFKQIQVEVRGRGISSTKERPNTIMGLEQTEQQDQDLAIGKRPAKKSL
jgi:hypothetical protein